MDVETRLRRTIQSRCPHCRKGPRFLVHDKAFEIEISPRKQIREVASGMTGFETADLIRQVRGLVRRCATLLGEGYSRTFIDACDHWFWVERPISVKEAVRILRKARRTGTYVSMRCRNCGWHDSLPEDLLADLRRSNETKRPPHAPRAPLDVETLPTLRMGRHASTRHDDEI